MSLVGNLEDLGLGDILQIVSLSRKSGVLSLSSRSREGKIVFLNGPVTRASSSVFRENLGDLLLRRALVDLDTLKKALLLQKNTDNPPKIGTILAQKFGVSKECIEEVVKEQIEKIVYSFFGWGEGTFSFELGNPGDLATTHLDPLQFMLEQGLNPQWLAMEGSRILDEKLHRGESLDEEGCESTVQVEELLSDQESLPEKFVELESAVADRNSNVLLVVDDDEETGELLGKTLKQRGFTVYVFDNSRSFLQALKQAAGRDENPSALIDLIMPGMDGSGVLGGFEVLGTVIKQYPDLDVVVMTDHPNEEVERRVLRMGVPAVLIKPGRQEVLFPDAQAAFDSLSERIAAHLLREGEDQSGQAVYDFRKELLQELGEESPPDSAATGLESPGLYLLKGMLQELNNPALGGGIILLVLRFASELMSRAVVFLVKEDEIVGLGQFGVDLAGGMADSRIRKTRIPKDRRSVLTEVLDRKSPMKVKLGDGAGDVYLREQLGGADPEEVFLGPIVSEGKVVALLYGDNLPENIPIGDTESLEIFLAQAGMAMEKALLERRLRKLN